MAASIVVWIASVTLAQNAASEVSNFSAERLMPARDRAGVIDTEWGDVPAHLAWDAALWFNYARNPIVVYRRTGAGVEREGGLVENRLDGDLIGTIGLFGWLAIGADLPVTFYQGRPDAITIDGLPTALASLQTVSVGDLKLAPKVRLLRSRKHGIDLAIFGVLALPTSGSKDYLGEPGVSFAPGLAISRAVGGLRLAANAGYWIRERTEALALVVDDEVTYRAGVGYRFGGTGDGPPLELDAALSGSFSSDAPFQHRNTSPTELLGAIRYELTKGVEASAGAGFGIGTGFASPDYRVFAGLRLFDDDRDGDGIRDANDDCPEIPEDIDGIADEDGCPEVEEEIVRDLDPDKDRILDPDDACPAVAGIAENKGCPDADEDGDGIVDRLDRCPKEAEDKDEFEDEDGCPDLDNDKDGIADAADKCPNEKGPLENKGCPDADRDGDTVVDRLDNCPDEPGSPDNQGCKKQQLVAIARERLEIKERVYFDTAKATIQRRSYALLDNVAAVLKAHPEIKRVVIEGHTDSVGGDESNKKLSQRRAEAVQLYLMERGIAATRLSAIGYGEERPVETNGTKEGRAINRRVDFIIPEGQDVVE